MRVLYRYPEGGVVRTTIIVLRPRCELLIGGHERARNVVCHKVRLRVDVQQAHDIIVPHNPASTMLRDVVRRFNDPVIVRIVEGIPRDLLALRADSAVLVGERIPLDVRVQENLRLSVFERERIVVADLCRSNRKSASHDRCQVA